LEQKLELNNSGRVRDKVERLGIFGAALEADIARQFSNIAKLVDIILSVQKAVDMDYVVLGISFKLFSKLSEVALLITHVHNRRKKTWEDGSQVKQTNKQKTSPMYLL
jgi:hypothetical protein